MVTVFGEPVEKEPLVALPEAETPGPKTAQLFTEEPLQERVVCEPLFTRSGVAEMVAVGWSTTTEAKAGAEEPPGPVQKT